MRSNESLNVNRDSKWLHVCDKNVLEDFLWDFVLVFSILFISLLIGKHESRFSWNSKFVSRSQNKHKQVTTTARMNRQRIDVSRGFDICQIWRMCVCVCSTIAAFAIELFVTMQNENNHKIQTSSCLRLPAGNVRNARFFQWKFYASIIYSNFTENDWISNQKKGVACKRRATRKSQSVPKSRMR